MQKLLFRPICHLPNQQASSILDELRSSLPNFQPQTQGFTSNNNININPQTNFHQSQFQMIHQGNNSNNSRANRFSSLQQGQGQGLHQYSSNNINNNHNHQQYNTPSHNQIPQGVFSSPSNNNVKVNGHNHNHNINSINNNDSIINVYGEFNSQKIQFEQLKQENSRLYYEKLALQTSMQRLKQDNLKKDQQINRLKQLLQQRNSMNKVTTLPNIQNIVSNTNIPTQSNIQTPQNIQNPTNYGPSSRNQPRQQNPMFQIINPPQLNNQVQMQYKPSNFDNKRAY